jgi:hypothetical protein
VPERTAAMLAVRESELYALNGISRRIATATEGIMKRAFISLAAAVALACLCDAAFAHGSVGVYVGGPVYVGPPPVIYRPYPPAIYGPPPVLYRSPPAVYWRAPGYYYGYPYGYRPWWGRPYWRGYGYGYGGYRGWHHYRYRR